MIISEKKKAIHRPADAADILRTILSKEHEVDRSKEHFWAVGMNGANVVQYIELVSLGIANRALVHPREVFRFAIMKGAVSMIVAHNHPSGNTEPSQDDRAVTRQLKDAGSVVGIQVLDHIIIAEDGGMYSFQEEGAL